jgi:calcium/calmodulin-dependent protein kinase I
MIFVDQNELFDAIMKGRYEFDEEYWGDISDEGKADTLLVVKMKLTCTQIAKHLINRLLTFDPKQRVTAEEALQDVWITSEEDNGVNLAPNVRKGFNSRRTLKSLVTAVAAINKLKLGDHFPHLEEEEEENGQVGVERKKEDTDEE